MGLESGWRSALRAWETRAYAGLRSSRADRVSVAGSLPWDAATLGGHRYCLLVSFRRDGRAVPTPVWFAPAAADRERIVIRSGASDGKVKRIRRESEVLVAPCTFRGDPVGPPMQGRARLLPEAEHAAAEAALRDALGLQRRLYALIRDPALEAAYIEVGERTTIREGHR